MTKKQEFEGIAMMELKGIARNVGDNFPITFDYSQTSGNAYLIGVRLVAPKQVGNKTIETRMDLRAFGEVAEELATLSDGDMLHIKGEYGMRQGQSDKKWYPIVTVSEVIEHVEG